MNSKDLYALLRFVADRRLKESYEIAQNMTMQQRETLANAFDEGATFLRKVNKEWKEALHFDPKREE